MEVLGEALLSPVLDFLFTQLASADLLRLASEEGVDTELKNWRKELVGIQLKLIDAEEKQITDGKVKSWLIDLRALVYDMEDVIDEFAYHVMRRKLMEAEADEPGTSKKRKLSNFILTSFTNFKPTHTVRLLNMRPKIQSISDRLQSISDTKGDLVLKEAIKKAAPARRTSIPTTEMACEGVYGREEDKRLIIDMLGKVETRENNLGVISIFGPGGAGKTTLARLVYNDDEVAAKFELKAWACVSDVFDLENITKSILNSVKGHDACRSSDFQTVQRQLRDALANKKFLLVLDDVWPHSDRQWDCLQIPLSATARGSKVIVTTRDKTVASNMGPSKNLHPLIPLSEEACWSVFEKQAFAFAFENEVDRGELEPIGRQIVAKYCRGSPLATKALGGLLRTKCTPKEWKAVLNSKLWELSRVKSEIFPVLFLSYHHLPSHLKRCFAYCAIFPQDYEFEPKMLVLLWMAEGLIAQPNSTSQTLEDLGDEYFLELLSRSFFQPSGSHRSGFMMHDLMHNLAQDVSDGMCYCLEGNLESGQRFQTQINNTRHLSFTQGKFHLFKKLESFSGLQHLRTFVALPIHWRSSTHYQAGSLVHDDLMSKFQRLRVLSLSRYMISVLPDSIGGLKNLCYLNLSYTHIESLPHTIRKLYNLQTLLLFGCKRLTRLPNDIEKLLSLRHLDVSGCPLEEMPHQIAKLKELQTLSDFIVGKRGLIGMNLPNLRGEICFRKLENVVDPQDVRDVNLKEKLKNIEKLSLVWWQRGVILYDEDVVYRKPHTNLNEKDVLSSLQPHTNLKELRIGGYGGEEFSDWISNPSYSNLVALSLSGCVKCKTVPSVGQLPCLKELSIGRMDGVESIGVEFEGQFSVYAKPFKSLECLSFSSMGKWKEWSWSPESFSSLRQLEIRRCKKLVGELPIHLASLVELKICGCPEMKVPLPEDFHSLQKFKKYSWEPRFVYRGRGAHKVTTAEAIRFKVRGMAGGLYEELKQFVPNAVELLEVDKSGELELEGVDGIGVGKPQSLEIRGYKQLESLGRWINNCHLEGLEIESCRSLTCFSIGPLALTLKQIHIWHCENLESPEDVCMCGALEELTLRWCPAVVGFPEGGLPPTLKMLTIHRCEKLRSLPEGIMQMRHSSTALRHLDIWRCPSLTCFPSGKFPSSLKTLRIGDCAKLPPLSNDMFDPFHNSLARLTLERYPHLELQPPHAFRNLTSLTSLEISDCPNIKTAVSEWGLATLTSLTSLSISACLNIQTPVSEWALAGLTSLTSLTLQDISPEASSFPHHHHHDLLPLPSTLRHLRISGFQNLESLAPLSLQTLTSLTTLFISDCPNLHSLMPKAGFPDMLSNLEIESCPKLHSFIPKDGLPDMLSKLTICDCPLLCKRYSRGIGEDWPKIAHIPNVFLDDRRLRAFKS